MKVINGYYLIGFVLLFYGVLSYLFYITLNKPVERGRQNMWEKIKKHLGICIIIGLIFLIIGFVFFGYTYYLFVTNNGQINWSHTLTIGFSFTSLGIAITSLCISRKSGRRLQRVIESDFENFIDLFENVRINFIEEAIKREGRIDRVNVEVLAWKSRQYFDRTFSVIEWIDESKLRHLSEYTKQLMLLIFARESNWRPLVWNRDVGNIVKMYQKLWGTGVINYAEPRIKNELLTLFVENIGARRPNEDDLTLFKRILETISPNPNETFVRIE